jgi:DNA-binding HxlR family transcriptional regulator
VAAPTGRTPLASALEQVGDRWSLLLVEALLDGPARFSELGRLVPGIAPNILVDRLRRLERAGILVAEPYSQRPLRLTYRLTEDGQGLGGVLRLLAAWGARGEDAARAPVHAACGTPVEAHWYCPTCGRAVERPEDAELDHV